VIYDIGTWGLGFRVRSSDLGFRIEGLGAWSLGFQVWGLGSRDKGIGSRV